jgi:hypothetical protein
MNSSVEVVESTAFWQNRKSLTSIAFGSDSQINMPVNCFIGQNILRLVLPPLQINQNICRGWGLRMLRQIRYQIGSSSSSPQIVLQHGIFSQLMMQCETEEKRSLLLKLCGEAKAYVEGNGSMEAYVPLPLPYSTVCDKLMYDASLLGQPITIFIQFELDPRMIYGGSTANIPTSFTTAEVLIRTRALSNPSKSLKNAMIADPELHYPYPFIMPLSYIAAIVDGGQPNYSVQFNQFQASDILSIAVSVVRNSDLVAPAANTSPSPYNLNDVFDLELIYNGSTLFNYPGLSHKAASCYLGNQQASDYSYCKWQPGESPTACTSLNPTLIVFDFTLIREACVGDHLANTFRIPPGGVLNFNFKLNGTFTNTDKFTVTYTCFYNAMLNTRAGTSSILTS